MDDIESFIKEQSEMQFIAVSNIYEDKLARLLELEINGLPCPSIQIKPIPKKENKADITENDSLFDFGSISFVFGKENIFGQHTTIPKNDPTHQIYSGDAYTLTFPYIVYSSRIKVQNEFRMRLIEQSNSDLCYYHDDFEFLFRIKRKNKSNLQEEFLKSLSLKLLFLTEAGFIDKMKVFKNTDSTNPRNKINKQKTDLFLRRLMVKAEKSYGCTFKNFVSYELNQFLHSPKIDGTNKEATLENITEWMKRNRGAGAEQNSHNTLGKSAARNKHMIRSLQDLKDKVSHISSKEDYVISKKSIELSRDKLMFKLTSISYEQFNHLIELMTYKQDPDIFKKQFDRWEVEYPSEATINDFISFVKENNQSNHLYFEAKPNKSFHFKHRYTIDDEKLKYVIVPNDINKDILAQLEKTDLTIFKYDRSKPETRVNAFYRCKDCFIKEDPQPTKKQKKTIKRN